MSYALDVNILLYATDEASPRHAAATALLRRCVAEAEPMCLAWATIMGYLRMITHPGIFAAPRRPAEAMDNIEALLSVPHVRVLREEEGFWDLYREVAGEGGLARGNAVPDVHLAALLRQHDVKVLYTGDADFRRFPFLEVRDPFAPARRRR